VIGITLDRLISASLFAKELRTRCDCVRRTDAAFQQALKRGVTFISTDYVIPSEICSMLNVIQDAKNQSFKLCTSDGVDKVRYKIA
jgi:hypothetical protein